MGDEREESCNGPYEAAAAVGLCVIPPVDLDADRPRITINGDGALSMTR
jgi:hypothetical protein